MSPLILTDTDGCQRRYNHFLGATSQRLIVGKWKEVNEPLTLQFFPDGTLILNDTKRSTEETYSFPDETHIKIVEPGGSYVVEVKITQKELSLIAHNSQHDTTTILSRVL
jgi:hypothetical protein